MSEVCFEANYSDNIKISFYGRSSLYKYRVRQAVSFSNSSMGEKVILYTSLSCRIMKRLACRALRAN